MHHTTTQCSRTRSIIPFHHVGQIVPPIPFWYIVPLTIWFFLTTTALMQCSHHICNAKRAVRKLFIFKISNLFHSPFSIGVLFLQLATSKFPTHFSPHQLQHPSVLLYLTVCWKNCKNQCGFDFLKVILHSPFLQFTWCHLPNLWPVISSSTNWFSSH